MRFMFFLSVFSLLQLFSYATGFALQWWLKPWLGKFDLKLVMGVVFVISNALFVLAMLRLIEGAYRWISGWLMLMLFVLFSAVLTLVLWVVLRHVLADHQLLWLLRGVSLTAVLAILGYGLHSAYVPVVRLLSIRIDKPLATPLRVAVASDLHLGTLFGAKQLQDLAQILREHEVDMLLMPGDIMDDDTLVFDARGMGEQMRQLPKAVNVGVYATLGNHDLYGHRQPISAAITDAGIHLLDDAVLQVGEVWLVGRLDDMIRGRADTEQLLTQVDTNAPVVLLDHRPTQVEAHSRLPIDLQVSGHTHNGQIFPASFIVQRMYRLAYGHEQIGRGHYLVTSGYGFWGIPFRLGSRSEVWVVDIVGQGESI